MMDRNTFRAGAKRLVRARSAKRLAFSVTCMRRAADRSITDELVVSARLAATPWRLRGVQAWWRAAQNTNLYHSAQHARLRYAGTEHCPHASDPGAPAWCAMMAALERMEAFPCQSQCMNWPHSAQDFFAPSGTTVIARRFPAGIRASVEGISHPAHIVQQFHL